MDFKKVSYDRILGEKVTEYQKVHDETDVNKVIDIIRSSADQEYLDRIARHCITEESDVTELDRENNPMAAIQHRGNFTAS